MRRRAVLVLCIFCRNYRVVHETLYLLILCLVHMQKGAIMINTNIEILIAKDNGKVYPAHDRSNDKTVLKTRSQHMTLMLHDGHPVEKNNIIHHFKNFEISSETESSQKDFATISLDELLAFESLLYDDNTFAIEHPVGVKIFEIIKRWNKFVSFENNVYYHARKIEKGVHPFLDQEMLKAPLNVSSHGRYNAIGKSCYYICDTKEGAVAEIRKHSSRGKSDIQVVGLKPVKMAQIIDLSGDIEGENSLVEHLRFTANNKEGQIIKEYLLPNFVASCCRRAGIDGIKYKSTGYNCCVLWEDDYFEFVEGSREIIVDVCS